MADDRRFQAHQLPEPEKKPTRSELLLVGSLIAFLGFLAVIVVLLTQ